MNIDKKYLQQQENFYKNQLLNDTIPFWFPKSIDEEFGGFLLMRDRDGSLLDDDKAVWIQGRATWLLATLYNTVEKKKEWLDGAKKGIDFLLSHCFAEDGQMYFHVTRDGKPIRKRRYFFSETFAVMAFAAYSKASGDQEFALKARELYGQCIYYAQNPQLFPAKYTETRKFKGFSIPMMMVVVSQQM